MDVLLQTTARVATETWSAFVEMAPWLLGGFLAAGFLSVFVSAQLIERHLGGNGPWPVVKASVFGVPLPICSCGVIPVAASLRKHGASRASTTSFLISTPQTGVDSILVTYSLLGPVFAIFRPVAALLSGILGGVAVALTGRDRHETEDEEVDPCHEACCEEDGGSRLARALRYGLVTLPRDLTRPLLIGLVVAGAIAALVPPELLAGHFGDGPLAYLVMLVAGIPVYVCATATVPVAAALILKGISPGAALVFLMTGPATNAATITTVWKVLGRRVGIVYLASVAITAVASGLALDAIASAVPVVPTAGAHHHEGHTPWELVLAAMLGVVLLRALLPARSGHSHGHDHPHDHGTEAEPDSASRSVKLEIGGMNCSACVDAVTRALREIAGVTRVDVDLGTGRAQVDGSGLDDARLVKTVEALGYRARPLGA